MGQEEGKTSSWRRGDRPLYKPGSRKQKERQQSSESPQTPDLPPQAESREVSPEDELARLDEIAVIESIYPDLFFQDSTTRIILSFERDIRLTVDLPFDYPSRSPPSFILSGPYLKSIERSSLTNALNEEFVNNLGMPVLYSWITVIQDFLRSSVEEEPSEEFDPEPFDEPVIDSSEPLLDIKHGEVFSDRKSHFQAHLCQVTSKEECMAVLRQLLANNKIARATHNMYAYRIRQAKDGREFNVHDCFDDGEDGASSKMLDILDKMKADNVMVVVTRWYGGIHLGPDRFRIINNLTRDIVTQYGPGT